MPHLPPEWAAHLQSGVSNRIGACASDGWPEICRALATRALPSGGIEVLLAADVGQAILQAVQATRWVALVGAHPGTNKVLHVKGRGAQVLPAQPEHMALLLHCRREFGRALEPYGYDEESLKKVWYDVELAQLRCIRFTPFGAWDQTPGIGAGAAIELLP
jgi:hypothetical protein